MTFRDNCIGNLMLAAHALGIGSCWIHRAKEEFESEEGKALLRSLGIEGDWEGIERMRAFFTAIGMPHNFAGLGAREEDIPALVQALCRGDGRQGSISGFVTLTEEDCANIYRMML